MSSRKMHPRETLGSLPGCPGPGQKFRNFRFVREEISCFSTHAKPRVREVHSRRPDEYQGRRHTTRYGYDLTRGHPPGSSMVAQQYGRIGPVVHEASKESKASARGGGGEGASTEVTRQAITVADTKRNCNSFNGYNVTYDGTLNGR